MDQQDRQEFSLDDILKEFGIHPDEEQPDNGAEVAPDSQAVTGDTIRMDAVSGTAAPADKVTGDTIRMEAIRMPKGQVRVAAPVEEEEEAPAPAAEEEAFSEGWEPEYEQPMGEYVPPQPIVFHPRSRLRELKRKLVAGPERRYYELTELGYLQAQDGQAAFTHIPNWYEWMQRIEERKWKSTTKK